MKVIYLGNNWVGWQVLKWLKDQPVEIVGAVVHPHKTQRHVKELLGEIELPKENIIDGTRLGEPMVLDQIKKLVPDIGISAFFGYILKPEFLEIFPRGVINLHPSYLPFNRGSNPNVWSIIEGTPAGVTLHYIDEGIDTGPIIAQEEVLVEPIDTGETLYCKLERASLDLFKAHWSEIQRDNVSPIKESAEQGTNHRSSDIEKTDRIDLEGTYRAKDLIDIIRARTFPPYKGAYFMVNGKKVYVRLSLEYEEKK